MKDSDGKVLFGGRSLWVAWYPRRGRRCQVRIDTRDRFFEVAFGPAYFLFGPGLPAV